MLDWESALPEDQLQETERQVAAADLVLCLGTSLQIVPVCNLPFKPAKAGARGGLESSDELVGHGVDLVFGFCAAWILPGHQCTLLEDPCS